MGFASKDPFGFFIFTLRTTLYVQVIVPDPLDEVSSIGVIVKIPVFWSGIAGPVRLARNTDTYHTTVVAEYHTSVVQK